MKITHLGDEILVEAPRWELFKLAGRLRAELGSIVRQTGPEAIVFPSQCAGRVSHFLQAIGNLPASLNQVVVANRRHADARSVVKRRLEEHPELPEKWAQILEPAQAQAVHAMTSPGILGLCLFDEQGSGKTVMTIAAFDILKQAGRIDAMVVICPKSMLGEWPSDITRFADGYKIEVAEGSAGSRFKSALTEFDVLITNYEGAARIIGPLSSLGKQRKFLLVVDESYFVKNTESLRSSSLRSLRGVCYKCFVLCGTPAPNSPQDLINQFDLADLGFTFGGFRPSDDPEKDRDAIEALVESRGTVIRRLKSEVLAVVPEKNFNLVRVSMEGRQRLLYDKARNALVLELRQLDNTRFKRRLAFYFQRRAALLQICSNPSSVDPTYAETPGKHKILDDLVSELIGGGQKVIVWSYYTRDIDNLMERYRHHKPARIDGSVDSNWRREAVRSFQDDPERMLFIGNPAAAGAGITLHASHNAIYVSYSNQAAHFLQSLDRIHRRGQKSPVVNYHLLYCANTIEETEIARLRDKEKQQHLLLGDNVQWPSSLDDALAELGDQP